MRIRLVTTAVTALLALGARDATAQGEGPRMYCPTDVPMGCFAMSWDVTPLVPPLTPGGGTEWHSLVTLRIRNVTPFGAPFFTVQGVTVLGEEYESGPGQGLFVRSGVQPATTEGVVGVSLDGLANMDESTGALGQGGTWTWIGPGIVGCQDLGDDPSLDWNYRTCDTEGQTGWVRLDFFVTLATGTEMGTELSPATPDHIYLAVFGNDGEGGEWLCTWVGADIPDDLGQRSPCTPLPFQAVVPEPGTMVLLGSGLMGLLGVGFLRRRSRR